MPRHSHFELPFLPLPCNHSWCSMSYGPPLHSCPLSGPPLPDNQAEAGFGCRDNSQQWCVQRECRGQILWHNQRQKTWDLLPEASAWRLVYSTTLAKILLVTFGRGMAASAQSSSIMFLIVCDSMAAASSTSKVWPSEVSNTNIFFEEVDIAFYIIYVRIWDGSWKEGRN